MKTHKLTSFLASVALGGSVLLTSNVALADASDTLINAGTSRINAGKASQKRIDGLHDQTEKAVANYHKERKAVESLKVFNDRLRRTIEAQSVAKTQLEQSIIEAALIERQIVPLMNRMIAGLQDFIKKDMPFKLEERLGRLERIEGYLTNANISAAERFRQVLEAYKAENAYGDSISVYPETIKFNGADVSVTILQIGRAAMYFQNGDGNLSGIYDKASRSWQELDSSHNAGILDAIRVAQKKVSPDLMLLPIPAPEGV
jgi:hypothetical protein